MAERIFFKSTPDAEAAYEEIPVEFEYFIGFARVQKQKSVESMHKAIEEKHPDLRVLEISTASEEKVGYDLSAHNLKLEDEKGDSYFIENIYQSSKVFWGGCSPYRDLLYIPPSEVRKEVKKRNPHALECFIYKDQIWPLKPKSIFYDWLYINAIKQRPGLGEKLLEYDAFTDINFYPKKSINCPARTAAIFVALAKRGQLDMVDTKEHFEEIAKTIYPPDALPDAQLSMFGNKNKLQPIVMNYNDQEVEQDYEKASCWYDKASGQGDVDCIGANWKDEIKEIIERRDIRGLLHFTRVECLASILQHGLVPRSLWSGYTINIEPNDDAKIDGDDVINMTVDYPNTIVLGTMQSRHFRNRRYPKNDWAIMVIDPRLLLDKEELVNYVIKYDIDDEGFLDTEYFRSPAHITFHQHNAATKNAKRGSSPSDFEAMFAPEIMYSTFNNGLQKVSRPRDWPSYRPTSIQAEITVSAIVPKEYFMRCLFNSKDNAEKWKEHLNVYGIESEFKMFPVR